MYSIIGICLDVCFVGAMSSKSMELARHFLGLLSRSTEYGGSCPTLIFVIENSMVLIGQLEHFSPLQSNDRTIGNNSTNTA